MQQRFFLSVEVNVWAFGPLCKKSGTVQARLCFWQGTTELGALMHGGIAVEKVKRSFGCPEGSACSAVYVTYLEVSEFICVHSVIRNFCGWFGLALISMVCDFRCGWPDWMGMVWFNSLRRKWELDWGSPKLNNSLRSLEVLQNSSLGSKYQLSTTEVTTFMWNCIKIKVVREC